MSNPIERVELGCSFCAQIAGRVAGNEVIKLLADACFVRPVLLESGQAVVMPSIGPLSRGHVLVCPTQHLRSTLEADSDVHADIEALIEEAREQLETLTGLPVHRFEHGSSRDGIRVACSVEHAHVHLVPADVVIWDRLPEIASWRLAPEDRARLREDVGGREFLLYEGPGTERVLATTDAGFPSQVLRQLLASALGSPSTWNWREHPCAAVMRESSALLRARVRTFAC
jgi:ATP adenylyltransferase